MNSNRFLYLLLFLAITLLCAPRLAAQNDRGPALNNVPALINNLADTKPLKQQVERTYSAEYFLTYSAAEDHVQGMARLANGNYVFSHSAKIDQKGLAIFSRPNADAIYKPFKLNELYRQSHPSAIQACGNIVAVPSTDSISSIHFFDASDPDNIVELTHLTITYTGGFELHRGIDAVGLVYNEMEQIHYLTVSTGSESGREDGAVWLFKSNGLPLTNPNCSFSYEDEWFFRAFTSAAGVNLLYDQDGTLYIASMYRTNPGGDERIRLSRIYFGKTTKYPKNKPPYLADTTYAHQVTDILLSGSGYYDNSVPGFRWGGGIAINGPNSIEVVASSRLITSPNGNHCVIKVWKGEAALEDCRRYSDVSWLTSHNAFAAQPYGYQVVNNQSVGLSEQIARGARAFTLDTWQKENLNAPNGLPAYNNLKDAMAANTVYLLNDPRRLKSDGDCCEGGSLQGTNWPTDLETQLPNALFDGWLASIGQFLLSNPSEIVTLILEGNATQDAFENALESLHPAYTNLIMNSSDYDNLYNLTLGEMRSSGRRLAVFREGGTYNFNLNGRSFQFRDRFSMTVENTTNQLFSGNVNNCDKRDESDGLGTGGRLVVFNHLGQEYHATIVRRWLEDCSNVNVPNFVVVNNADAGIFSIQPKDAVREFNRRLRERAVGGSLTYRIMAAEGTKDIRQESDGANARVVIANNVGEWEFILSDDDRSYYIRLKGTNRYIVAPILPTNACQMETDISSRARWYVEPLGTSGAVRIFTKHKYAGVQKAMRVVDDYLIKLSDNIDFVTVGDQKFTLVPVITLGATCKPAMVELDANGSGVLPFEAIKQQVDYSGICEGELYFSADTELFTCADLGTHQVTLTVTDGVTLSSSCTATVTVVDNLPPTVVCKNKTIALDANGAGSITTADVLESSQDNCGAPNPVSVLPNAFTCNDLGENTVTLTVSDGHDGNASCTAMVTVVDNAAPSITCPENIVRNTDPNLCSAVTTYGVTASDNCAHTLVRTSPANTASGSIFPKGTTTVNWKATDAAGNTSACTFTVTVTDNQAPSITCPGNQTAVPLNPATCNSVISGINADATDNCGVALTYALTGATTANGNGQASGLVFNSGPTTVTYTAADPSGNMTTCAFSVSVAPCANGRIIWKQDNVTGMKDVTVAVTGDQTTSMVTGVNGIYGFVFSVGSNFAISPSKNLNKLNGVNAQDVFRMQQHLSGNLITNPWQLIAADVNSNGAVNSLDLSIIQQGILGNPSALAQMIKSWRFVPTAHVIATPPWGFPEYIVLSGISGNQTGQDFYGIKVGDVVSAYANPANAGQGQPLVLRTPDQPLQAGQAISVALSADPLADLSALQFALGFDPEQLQLENIEVLDGLPLQTDNFGTHETALGKLRFLWAANGQAVSFKQSASLFRLHFKVLESGSRLSEVLGLDNERLPGHVYNSLSAESGVSLRFDAHTAVRNPQADAQVQLFQNRPNPFVSNTSIGFVLPEACEARLRILNAAGRVVAERNKQYPAGRHEETFGLSATPGILYYELTTPFGVQTKKMVKAE